MSDYETLKNMKEQVWHILLEYKICPDDNRNVARYEKLAKLHINLIRQLQRYEIVDDEDLEV
jgi:hypothetical protein